MLAISVNCCSRTACFAHVNSKLSPPEAEGPHPCWGLRVWARSPPSHCLSRQLKEASWMCLLSCFDESFGISDTEVRLLHNFQPVAVEGPRRQEVLTQS